MGILLDSPNRILAKTGHAFGAKASKIGEEEFDQAWLWTEYLCLSENSYVKIPTPYVVVLAGGASGGYQIIRAEHS